MVTSKFDVEVFFSHRWPLLNSRECLELMTACRSLTEMFTCSEVRSRASFRRASVIDSTTPKHINAESPLFASCLNHRSTEDVFFYWLTFVDEFPIYFFEDLFAYTAYLRFWRINQSTSRLVFNFFFQVCIKHPYTQDLSSSPTGQFRSFTAG